MSFICYVFQAGKTVPYMEAAPGDTFSGAWDLARSLLGDHTDAIAVEIIEDDCETPVARLVRP